MKLTDNEKMVLREAQCDYVLGYWAARVMGLSRNAARREAVTGLSRNAARREAVTGVFAFAKASRVKFLLAHYRLWATHTIRASIADEA